MALYILQPGLQPVGQFDLLDSDLSSVVGGEIAVLDEASRTNTATEKASADAHDGYIANEVDIGTATSSRTVARIADGYSDVFLDATKNNIKVEPYKLFYLMDDGTASYGTVLGGLIGSPLGLGTAVSANLGPHSAAGSGKVSLWDKPGLYAITFNAASDLLNPSTGNLQDTPFPGELLYREHNTGKLTTDNITEDKIAQFVELSNNRSLVTTPAKLVGATESFDRIVIQYLGASFAARNA